MYYLKPEKNGRCIIYGYIPDGEYFETKDLPSPLGFRQGYDQAIFTDFKTAWREYVKPVSETEMLRERIAELEQIVADLASLQLEVMMNG